MSYWILVAAGDDLLPDIYELPLDLFDCLLTSLPPLALQKLQEQLLASDFVICSQNRSISWRALYKSRWPGLVRRVQPVDWLAKEGEENYEVTYDWQQIYWETHLQEYALLLRTSKLESLELRWIKSNEHGAHATSYIRTFIRLPETTLIICFLMSAIFEDSFEYNLLGKVVGLCKLLDQNSETLTSIEFIHCKLSSTFVDAICDSLHIKGLQTHGVKHFSIKTSSFMEINSLPLPVGLASFLSSGRSLTLLSLSDNNLQQNFAKMVLNTLLDASSSIVILDLSENNIAGWLSDFKWRSTSCSKLYSGIGKSLQSLRVLNLRNTNLQKDDADCLIYALVHMPNLGTLDLSDNPIEDDGMKSLISYFVEISEREPPFTELKLENCELTCKGVSQLLGVLSQLKKPLNALSIGDNDLGIKVGAPLGKYLCTGIRSLNIEDIGLCSSGFLEAQEELMEELKLVYINISKNRGGIETAKFLSKLISQSPRLVAVNAGYNFMPVESLSAICSGLKVAKGKLEHLDLTGNSFCDQSAEASVLAGFQIHGKPIIVLSSLPASNQPYDDDP
ncbi:unnamed protein product [Ilex paraguariensis]|uniref:Uncharacterized protein n=1 Tax=Ilex paraguariensis TaxID=185542 RepID=A0ABC8T7L9_9AQUA